MSVLQDLAAGLRSSSEHLPIDTVIAAADRLNVATELLAWVRRSSPHPLGVPQLTQSVEHLEQALRMLLSARDDLDAYLAALGLAPVPGQRPTGELVRSAPPPPDEPPRPDQPAKVAPLERWWVIRVDQLTGTEPSPGQRTPQNASQHTSRTAQTARNRQHDSNELLREVAERIRSDDRSGLRETLREAHPPAGLALASVSPAALRRLAGDLLGHRPGPEDHKRLQELTRSRIRELLPGSPENTSGLLLGRICRLSPKEMERYRPPESPADDKGQGQDTGNQGGPERETGPRPEHPADSAVTGAVLVGLLLRRLGRDPDTLRQDRSVPEPNEPDRSGSRGHDG